jgi:hypothetical protein
VVLADGYADRVELSVYAKAMMKALP